MLYLDSNAFIYPALYDGEKAESSGDFLKMVVSGKAAAATASLTFDEVVWVLSRETSRETAIDEGKRLLALPNLRILDVDGEIVASGLIEMERNPSLSPRDAVHLATAKTHGIYTVATDDRDFGKIDSVERRALTELPGPKDLD